MLSLHRCKVCGTRWLLWPDAIHGGGWNLLDKYSRPGSCCDNAAMGDQIEHLRDFDLTALRACAEARPSTEQVEGAQHVESETDASAGSSRVRGGGDSGDDMARAGGNAVAEARPSTDKVGEDALSRSEKRADALAPPEPNEAFEDALIGTVLDGVTPWLDADGEPALRANMGLIRSALRKLPAPPRAEALAPHPHKTEETNDALSRVPDGGSSESSSPPRKPLRAESEHLNVKCQGCGTMIRWTSLYGDWCSVCKPRN